ncbi:MAG: nucleotide-binding protein [Candidatus Roizmanbacteria bacterium]
MNNNIFVIHGHDSVALLEIKEFLRKLGLNPIVLQDLPNRNMTVIEKFEKYASSCVFAIAILTPDDMQAEKLDSANKYRARQNVILEAGWFMGKLGRQRVMLLHKGDVEFPSDIFGVLYLSFDKTIMDASEKLRDELVAQGLI